MTVRVRRAVLSDAPNVAAAEKAYIDCPWTYEQIVGDMENPDCLFFTAETDSGEFAGYASGVVAADECEVSNIAVACKFRRRGVGEKLLSELIASAEKNGASNMFLLVETENRPAIGLYKKLGFETVGLRRGYYNGKDAAIMRKSIE